MRLLIISDAWEPQINGVVRTYQNITAELTAMGHVVEVIGPKTFIGIPTPGYKEIKLALFPYRQLHKKIQDFAPDAIHIAVEGPLGWSARRYCHWRRMPYTTSYHTQFPQYIGERLARFGQKAQKFGEWLGTIFVRRFHARSAKVFITTPTMRDELLAMGFTAPLQLMTRGVHTHIFKPAPKSLFLDKPGPVWIYVGRLSIEKNLDAFLSTPLEGTKVVVGTGPDEARLKQLYPHVVFCGLQQGEDLAKHYQSADVFVFPSKTDTFGIVLIEALACGIPIAGFKVAGPVDIVTKDILGSIDDDLTVAMQNALLTPGSKEDRHSYIKQRYSWHEVAQTFITEQKRLEKRV